MEMDSKLKNVLLGAGTIAALGVVTYFISSDAAQEKVEAMVNRQKAKHFVKDTLKGNKRAMSVIDKLSDDEIAHLLGTVDKVGDLEDRLSDYSDQLKNVTSDVKNMFMDKTHMLKEKFKG